MHTGRTPPLNNSSLWLNAVQKRTKLPQFFTGNKLLAACVIVNRAAGHLQYVICERTDTADRRHPASPSGRPCDRYICDIVSRLAAQWRRPRWVRCTVWYTAAGHTLTWNWHLALCSQPKLNWLEKVKNSRKCQKLPPHVPLYRSLPVCQCQWQCQRKFLLQFREYFL